MNNHVHKSHANKQTKQPNQPHQQSASHNGEHHHHADTTVSLDETTMHGSPAAAQAGTNSAHHHDTTTTASDPHRGHGGHAGHSADMFKRPFWISLLLTIPVLIYAELIQEVAGYTAPTFPGSQYLPFVLGSVIYWYGGWVFLTGTRDELRARQLGMMTLVTLAITTAYVYSIAGTFGFVTGMPFYWELATLVTVMLLGHWMELRAIGSAQSALSELAKLLPDTAERIINGQTETVPVSALQPGDLVLVRPGSSIPADGTVAQGESQVSEAMITGESRPVQKQPGMEVIAGTANGNGSLRVEVTRTGTDTALSGIMRLVAQAQTSRSHAQALADRAAAWLAYIAIGVALLTLAAWVGLRGFDNYTLERVVTVLVVACPHALGLAIPLVLAISTSLSARNGILVSDRLALEEARTITTVVFDKTGTLTRGEQGLVGTITAGRDEREALALAAAVEGDSEHIIARAIRDAANEHGLTLPAVEDFHALPGRGVQGVVNNQSVKIGGPRLLESERITLPDQIAAQARRWGARGQTVVYLVEDGTASAAFATADVIRPESREAVAALTAQGIRVAMLTGDSQEVAHWVADELGIETTFAEVLPEHKSQKIAELQRQGEKVAMVGDGVNDAPALAQADVGIAIGAGTDVARAAAGIVLVRNDPRDIVRILRLSRASYRKMVQNLGWAVGYNAIALPLAAGVLAGVGFVLPVWIGAVLMSLSTVIVALNAQTLRWLDVRGE